MPFSANTSGTRPPPRSLRKADSSGKFALAAGRHWAQNRGQWGSPLGRVRCARLAHPSSASFRSPNLWSASARPSHSRQAAWFCFRRRPRHNLISMASSAGRSGGQATVTARQAIIPRLRIPHRTTTIRMMILPLTAKTAKASRAPTAATTITPARTVRVPVAHNPRPRIRLPKAGHRAAARPARRPNRRAMSRASRRRADQRRSRPQIIDY